MNLPIDTCENGSCSFAIRGEYDKRVYAKNLGLGGALPGNGGVCGVSMCGRMRDDSSRPLPQGGRKQSDRRDILNKRDWSY